MFMQCFTILDINNVCKGNVTPNINHELLPLKLLEDLASSYDDALTF